MSEGRFSVVAAQSGKNKNKKKIKQETIDNCRENEADGLEEIKSDCTLRV